MRKSNWAARVGRVKKTSLMLPEALWNAVRFRSLEENRNAQEIVAEALEDYLRKVKKGGKDAFMAVACGRGSLTRDLAKPPTAKD